MPGQKQTLDDVKEDIGMEQTPADTIHNLIKSMESELESGSVDTNEDAKADGEASRDERGRFARAEGDEDGSESTDEDTEADASDTKTTKAGDEEAEGTEKEDDELQPIEPPASWELEDQERFRSLSPEHQTWVLEQKEAAREAAERAESLNSRVSSLDEIIQPRRDQWAMSGMDEATAIRQLLALSDWATDKPQDFVRYFVNQRGITPEQIWNMAQQENNLDIDDDDPYADPAITSLRKELNALKQQNAQLQTGVSSWQTQQQAAQQAAQQAQEEAQRAAVRSQIDQFRSEKDESGKEAHPYFGEVQGLMSSLIQSNQAADLSSAYEMACRAHTGVSAKIAAAANAASQRELANAAKKKADAARKAGTSVSGSSSSLSSSTPSTTGDAREDMRAAFRDAGYTV